MPAAQLQPYVKYFVVSENELESTYKVFPTTGLVIGFQYRGRLALVSQVAEQQLASAGVTGITDGYRIFKNSAHIGTILVYFTETGFASFAAQPVNELFNLSLSLEDLFSKNSVREIEEKLSLAITDKQRIKITEQFLLGQLKNIQADKLVVEAIKLIYQSGGSIRIQELAKMLFISQSPLEKRFRKIVGTSPKKFASIVRLNTVMDHMGPAKSLSEICFENNFFDQAHFIKSFKQFTGHTPESFKSSR